MSQRLVSVAEMLGQVQNNNGGALYKYNCVADVGCDHGYVSIYLVQRGIAERAIAMDVRSGPLSAAGRNIESFGLMEKVNTRLSDGISLLSPGEADALVIAGMGGKLMISILERKDLSALGIRTAILQPQSDIPEFCRYLRDKGYFIEDERIILEDGKYYFPMRVAIHSSDSALPQVSHLLPDLSDVDILRICNRYGEHNILRRDPLLKDYLTHGKEVCESILKSLDSDQHKDRVEEVIQERSDIEILLKLF